MKEHSIKVAICYSSSQIQHSGSWTTSWIEFCKRENINFEFLNVMDLGIIDRLREFKLLLWHFTGFSFTNMLMARSIIYSAKSIGIKVFPDFNEAWHFDDKIAESYLLKAADAPIPDFFVFYSLESVREWLKNHQEYPVVAKLRNGSGSHNVTLIRNVREAEKYSLKMFSTGINSTPSIAFKAKSNIQSARSFKTLTNRFKRIPEFLSMRKRATFFPREKGYVFFQEYIPNNDYDIKVVVVGEKLSFIGRRVRKDDFRASGGGNLFYDKSLINQEIIDLTFSVSDRLAFQCMGYDLVVSKNTGKAKIVEISYGFSHTALLEAGGYFDRHGAWFNKPLNAPDEVLSNLLRF